ncbi:hypothetical protein [Cecembia sp.]|uniref:hypothetical protein n=1 Tax=Cecembia sp. TaxID=1898110 RepID=UPI0025C681A8|nr:hypothetical protein [Cecembia sp.]
MAKKLKNIITCLAICFLPWSIQAQEIIVEGYFLQDSAKLGERIPYVLKAKYGAGQNIVFPDSTYDYSPFVLLEKKTFMSSTKDGVTLDSAIYYVSNFSLEPVIEFTIPVFEVFKYDSLKHEPLESSLTLKLIIDQIPDELAFRDNNVYQPIPTVFNYPLWISILVGIVILGFILFFFFGNKLQKRWDIWMEKKRYKRFEKRWRAAEDAFKKQPDMDQADELLGLWKTYMEHLKAKPFREWTTTEIAEFLENKAIIKDFRDIEMIIYAGKTSDGLPQACQNLWKICSDSYQQKITLTDERQ